MSLLGWVVLAVVVIVIIAVARGGGGGAAAGAAGGCAYPADPDDPPATPGTSGWPSRGPGWRGRWSTAPDTLVTLTTDNFVWESHWVTPGLDIQPARAQGRVIIFRLVDNPLVKIDGITGGGDVAGDRRSAYSCCDADGRIVVTLRAEAGAAHEGAGGLWGIDVEVGNDGSGLLTRFEVRTP